MSSDQYEPSRFQSATVGVSGAAPIQPLSKLFYFSMVIVGSLIIFLVNAFQLFCLWVYQEGRGADREVVPIILLVSELPVFLGILLDFGARTMLVYKMWAVIQGGPARTTPGLACGLLFIPLFNLYWAFRAYWGWTKDFNQFVAARGIATERVPEGVAMMLCILWSLSLCPPVGICTGPINIILLLMFMNSAINGVNAVIAASPKPVMA